MTTTQNNWQRYCAVLLAAGTAWIGVAFNKKLWLLTAPLAMLMSGCFHSGDKNNGGNTGPNTGNPGSNTVGAGPARVELGTAGNFVILAGTTITNTGPSAVTGDIGLGSASAAITGFNLSPTIPETTTTFSTSTQVVSPGKVYATDYASPTPANLATAISNMEKAYNDAAGRAAPNFTDLDLGLIGGKTLVPGLYKWNTGVVVSSDVTLNGGPDAVWIFQTSAVVLNAGARILLTGGAKAKNIFWQSSGGVTVGSTAKMEGNILSGSGIALGSGAIVNGRLLAQVAVTLDASTVTQPDAVVTPPMTDTTAPSVNSTAPANLAIDVAVSGNITATFSEAMQAATISSASFTLKQGTTTVPGTVSYVGNIATLNPDTDLATNTEFTVTLTTAITDLANNALAAKTWSFKTAAASVPGNNLQPVSLGTAGNFVILAGTAITSTGSVITGDVGVNNSYASMLSLLSLPVDTSQPSATSAQVVGSGVVYANDFADPTPADLTTAENDMVSAYNNAAGRTAQNFNEVDGGTINTFVKILPSGLYYWSTGVVVATNIILNGGPNDVWIFQVSNGLVLNANARITLTGGAQAKNIFWQTGGGVVLGANAHLEGIVLSNAGITLASGATVNGRLLAPAAVTLNANTVSQPSTVLAP